MYPSPARPSPSPAAARAAAARRAAGVPLPHETRPVARLRADGRRPGRAL